MLARGLLLLSPLVLTQCPRNQDDAIMLHIYHKWNTEIMRATLGTDIEPSYLASIISLESHPPGNPDSERFEPAIYDRLVELQNGTRGFGRIKRETVAGMKDKDLRQLATSFGLTQVMGFHCLELGCSIQDLKGKYHLQWAVGYMMRHYGEHAKKRDWNACFRIHNTGTARGEPARRDYVDDGLIRMTYYERWMKNGGNVFKLN